MYYLSECLIIRDENQYLIEHLEKGVQAGIEHFFIYDNVSKIPVKEYILANDLANDKHLSELCTVELFQSTRVTQTDCYKKFLADHREDTKWCAFIDTDEMLEGSLIELCKQNEDYLSLKIRQILHGANGQAYADYSKTLTERFQQHVLTKISMYKCVSQVKYVTVQEPHNSRVGNTDIHMKYWLKNIGYNETCQLHHYFYRSFEEWLKKVLRGNVFSQYGWRVGGFFQENTIPDEDRDKLLQQYGLTLNDRMFYSERVKNRNINNN